MPLVFVLVPLIALLAINLPLGALGRRLGFPAAALLALLQVGAVLAAPGAWTGAGASAASIGGLKLELVADRLSLLLLLAIGVAALASVCVARGLEGASGRGGTRFYDLVLLAMVGMNGVSLVSDFFSLYVFIEVTAVSSYVLISMERAKDGLEGAFKYLILSAIATLMMLGSIGLLMASVGDTGFAAVAAAVRGPGPAASGAPDWTLLLAAGLFVGGLCVKGGLVPFHGWVPDAYSSAPAPASVLLAGIVTKTTGVYTLIRLSLSVFSGAFHLGPVFLALGILTAVVGALAAMWQKDMKRMLAYSSVSQVGYIVLALGAGSPLGAAAAAFHLFNHTLFKGQLFVNAAAVEAQAGTRDMDRLGGLGSCMPVTSWTSVVAFLSAAGIPPLSGFWSKLLIILALWKAGQQGFAVAAILASILTLAYFLILQRKVFFGKPVGELCAVEEASPWLVVPAIAMAATTVALGILFPLLWNTILVQVGGI